MFSRLNRDTRKDFFGSFKTDLAKAEDKFNEKFTQVFLSELKETQNSDTEFLRFQKEALSNLLGNIGYQYGGMMHAVLGMKRKWIPIEGKPFGLLSSYPARSRFPRAFMFDEGYHLLVICKWSDLLCVDILRSWFTT